MRSFRHPRWQHLDYRVKVATTQENKPPTQGTRQWTFTTPRWQCGSILLPSLNAGVPEPTGGEKLIRSGHYHYQCVYQIWEQSIPRFLSYRVNTITGGGRRAAGGGWLRRKTITSPDPSDTGDIINLPIQTISWLSGFDSRKGNFSTSLRLGKFCFFSFIIRNKRCRSGSYNLQLIRKCTSSSMV